MFHRTLPVRRPCALNKRCFTMCLSELDYVLCQSVRMRALISCDTCHVNGLSDDTPRSPIVHTSDIVPVHQELLKPISGALVLVSDRDGGDLPQNKGAYTPVFCYKTKLSPVPSSCIHIISTRIIVPVNTPHELFICSVLFVVYVWGCNYNGWKRSYCAGSDLGRFTLAPAHNRHAH